MLDFLSLETKRYLVDNRDEITTAIKNGAKTMVTAAIGSAAVIVFNIHDVERKVIVRDNPDEDFIELEDLSWTNEIRDYVHDKERRKNLMNHLLSNEEAKKKKKKKDKKNKNEEGGLFND